MNSISRVLCYHLMRVVVVVDDAVVVVVAVVVAVSWLGG